MMLGYSGLLFIFLITLLSVNSVTSEDGVTVTSKASLHVTDFGEGILRLTLKPLVEWNYEVEHVVVRAPKERDLKSTSDGVNTVIQSGPCTIKTNLNDETLSASYHCHGSELSAVKASMDSLDAPSLEFTFPAAHRLYGIPEHSTDLSLHANMTYLMYNTDAFQYRIDDPQALYGSIPFLMAHSKSVTTGVLFLNSAGMKVTILPGDTSSCRWDAEAGLIDLFFFPGPTPAAVQRQHASITGTAFLPPLFSLGYHQCRWNYRSTNDCLSVDQGFDRHNLPYDVLWLDIEHTDGKKYFTWDKHNFPEPGVLVKALASKGRKLVTVKDPHVKRESGYFVHEEATSGDYYVKSSDGNVYEGNCWPGRSSWVDFYNKRARDWYASLFHHDRYEGGSHDVHSWVDMNEPSVFDTSDKTIVRDAVHTSDSGRKVENKYIHNMYSLLSIMAVHQGHMELSKGQSQVMRSFILTRSFFAGSQRYAAMWTGDNMARWDHLQNSFPELLALSLSNYPFVGADIGGFFFEPDEELFVRWMQASVFYPFMRGHAHLETKRREPWIYGDAATDRVRVALALRYSLLPYIYTQFYHSHKFGETILRPLFYEFPHDEKLYDEQYTFMFGPALLASPVLHQGSTEKEVIIPGEGVWYSYETGEVVPHGSYHMTVDMDSIPLFLRGGFIIPVKLRMRRSSYGTRHDPFTLYIALNERGNSAGDVYIDDGETFDYESGLFAHRQFTFSGNQLTCTAFFGTGSPLFDVRNTVERIIIFGYAGRPKRVLISSSGEGILVGKEIEYENQGGALVLRKPDLPVGKDWVVVFEQ